MSIVSFRPDSNAPIIVRGNGFINNTAPSEALALFNFDIQGTSTSPHVVEYNVWLGNVLRGPAADLGLPHDRGALAPIVRFVVLDSRQAGLVFSNNVLRNPLARFELSLQARYDTCQCMFIWPFFAPPR